MIRRWLTSFFLLSSVVVSAQDFDIKLSRQNPIGCTRRTTVRVKEENRLSILINGKPIQAKNEKMVLELQADVENISPENKGKERLKIIVKSIKYTQDGQNIETIPANSIIFAEDQDDTTIFYNSSKVAFPDETQKYLRLAISTNNSEEDDKMFGANGRKKLGDSWPINKEHTISSIRELGGRVQPEKVTGSVQLKELIKDQGVDCLNIVVTMNCREVGGMPGVPPDWKFTKSTVDCKMSGLFPVDATKDKQQSSEDFDYEFIATGKIPTDEGNVDATFSGRMRLISEATWTILTKTNTTTPKSE